LQLHLNPDELNLLADTLLERVGMILAEKSSAASVQGNEDRDQAVRRYDHLLLDKVLARDLRLDSDELEQVTDLFREQKCDLDDEIARMQNSAVRLKLQQKLGLVERILERVEEARAML
jgi:DNA-binding transcriptional MerR regulator